MKQDVRIVLADAQYLARAGFRHLLQEQEHLHVIGEAGSYDELEEVAKTLKPDVVIFDYYNSEEFSIDDICRISTVSPETNFLVVTGESEKASIFKVLECGVNSILTKHCSKEEIIAGIKSTSRAEKFFCNKVLNVILEKHLSPKEDEDCHPSVLSAREIEIVELVAKGIPTKEIADQLCLSTHTVYTHRKNIMKKLSINSVSEMIIYAINSGIVKPGAS